MLYCCLSPLGKEEKEKERRGSLCLLHAERRNLLERKSTTFPGEGAGRKGTRRFVFFPKRKRRREGFWWFVKGRGKAGNWRYGGAKNPQRGEEGVAIAYLMVGEKRGGGATTSGDRSPSHRNRRKGGKRRLAIAVSARRKKKNTSDDVVSGPGEKRVEGERVSP